MNESITRLSGAEKLKMTDLDFYEQFIEHPFPKKSKCAAILITFKIENKIGRYTGLTTEILSAKNFRDYGYRKGSSRGGDITFTTKFSSGVDKKLNTIINNQFPKTIELAKSEFPNEVKLFVLWKEALETSYGDILSDLLSKYESLEKDYKTTTVITFSIEVDQKKHLLIDFNTIKRQIEINGTEGKYSKHGTTSKATKQMCSVCHKIQPIVLGFGSPFKFSTVDKPGMVAGFFDQKTNWKNYPICETCSFEMELGKRYLDTELRFSFYGLSLYIIPKSILDDEESLQTALEMLELIRNKITLKDVNKIQRSEDILMRELGELDNMVTLSFLFFEENMTNKSIKLKLHLEDLPPSRFRHLFLETPKHIENKPVFENAVYFFKDKEYHDLKFNFGIIHTFFADNFLEMISKIIYNKPIHRKNLFNRFSQKFQSNYTNQQTNRNYESGSTLALKSMMLYEYLHHLKLINN